MKIRGHPVDLIVDMSVEHSVVNQLVGPLSNKHATIIGATGDQSAAISQWLDNAIRSYGREEGVMT
jgi:dihydrodipicolinate reductase